MSDDDELTAEVVDIAAARDVLPRSERSRPGIRSCDHLALTVFEDTGTVECRTCGQQIEPLRALLCLSKTGNRWRNAQASAKAEVDRLRERRDDLKREIDRLYRERRKARAAP